MEREVIFRSRQQQTATDHNNVQAFMRESLDDVVHDAISAAKGFAGFAVTLATPTTLNVAAGRLFDSGRVYISLDVATIDLFPVLPVATKKIVAIVSWGIDGSPFDVQPRDFLINATTRQTQPDAVAMETRRAAQVDRVVGVESVDPVRPATDSSVLVLAYVTLGTGGVLMIEMATDNVLPNLADHERRIGGLEDWEAVTGPRIATIQSDLAKLAAAIQGKAANRDLTRVLADIARLKVLENLPDTYADYAADFFLTKDETDTTNLNLLAKVEEGVRFSAEAENIQALSLFSNLDANAQITGGFLLPKWSLVQRMSSVAYTGAVLISQYGYQTMETVQRMMARMRTRYGTPFTVCTNSAFWRSGTYDPNTHIFSKDGETFLILAGDPGAAHVAIRLEQYWVDFYEEPYWDYVVVPRSVYGAVVAQSFLNSADGWLAQVGLFFVAKAAAGDVNVVICECGTNGAPDVSKVIASTTLTWAAIVVSASVSTKVTLPPTFLKAGKRYAIVLISAAAHTVGISATGAYTQGTLFYSTDGAYQMGDLTKDLMFELYFCRFAAPRVSIALNPISLSGGITAIDIMAESVVPENCSLTYEVQIGSSWTPLSGLTPNLLIGLPPLIPLRATFVGTTDIAAGINLTGSICHFSRPRKDFNHISALREPAASTSTIKVMERVEKFNAANHTIEVRLWPAGDSTIELLATGHEDVVVEVEDGSHKTIERTWSFTVPDDSVYGGETATYKIRSIGHTETALDVFHIAERVDIDF